MAIRLVSAAQMRMLDRVTIEEFGVPSFALMERAARGAVKVFHRHFPAESRKRVLIVAGKGNNGGDGMVCARLLAEQGISVSVALLADPGDLKGDAARAYRELVGTAISVVPNINPRELAALLSDATAVFDGLLGTGLNSPVSGALAEAIDLLNGSGKPILALDTPSGLDSDRGIPLGRAVCANVTATFGLPKVGLVVYPGRAFVGRLEVVDIGIPEAAVTRAEPRYWQLEAVDVARRLIHRPPTAHKGTCGHVLVVGGAIGRTGAAKMAAEGALRAGAGLVTLAGPASLQLTLSSHLPEMMTLPLPDRGGQLRFDETALRKALEGKTAVVLGPGMGVSEDGRNFVSFILEKTDVPAVCDADALTCLAELWARGHTRRTNLVLTPHPGEFARLTGIVVPEVQQNRPLLAREFAVRHGCVLVLKGASTVIAEENGTVWVNPTGNPGMASGGMGDVLAGLLGGFLAQGLRAVDAALVAVYIHGAAADSLAQSYGETGYVATEVAREVPRQLHALRDTS
ncbi:MAG: NAD(P)H-hydrate dehydratase [Candidatus Binatia bacterium]|nr:NAD(P)H-hydrate dehydratase [Candidatus Binatia bacterium]